MGLVAPRTLYKKLKFLDRVDLLKSAFYRELAQDVLADPRVNLGLRQAIADRLSQANMMLVMQTVDNDDSY